MFKPSRCLHIHVIKYKTHVNHINPHWPFVETCRIHRTHSKVIFLMLALDNVDFNRHTEDHWLVPVGSSNGFELDVTFQPK